jgi:hypothetical protein
MEKEGRYEQEIKNSMRFLLVLDIQEQNITSSNG